MKRAFRSPLRLSSRALALLAALAAAPAAGCGVPDAPAATTQPVKEVPVRVAPVRREMIARPVHASGRVGHDSEARLSFKVGGVVARILVDEGAHVRRGQLLATLDPREIDAQLSSAESARVKAERDLARAQVLRREDAVPGEVLDDATTAAEVARATAAAARFNRRFSEVRAPADGVVLSRPVEPGEVVGPGTPILLMGAGGGAVERVVRVGLADRDVVRLAPGDPAEIRLDALPDRMLTGSVVEIAPAASPSTGLFEVKVRIAGPAPGRTAAAAPLAAGMVAEVEIQPRATEPVTTVPLAALVDADGARGRVFALAPDRRHALPRDVSIGFLFGDRVALAGGLDGVAEVVSEGAPYLDERSLLAVKP